MVKFARKFDVKKILSFEQLRRQRELEKWINHCAIVKALGL